MKKRCPWCGELIPEKFFPFGGYICPSCNNHSKLYRFGGVYIALFFIGLVLLFAIDCFLSFKSIWLIFILYAFVSLTLPLEIDSKHFIPQKQGRAEFTLINNFFVLKKRIIFSEKRNFLICFVDEHDIPISHMICCSLEDIIFETKVKGTAAIKFVPLSENKVEFPSKTKFFIFIEETRVAEGRLTEDVK